MDHPILYIVMRYLHIVSALTAVGGLVYLISVLLPASKQLPDEQRGTLLKTAHDRYLRILWMAIGGLTVSGIYTWIRYASFYKSLGPVGNALIGTKVLLAVILFALVFARSIGLFQPKNPRTLPMINLHIAALIMLLGGILRYYHDAPTTTP